MRYLIIILTILITGLIWAYQVPTGQAGTTRTIKKSLGDINGDKKPETEVMVVKFGESRDVVKVKIVSGDKLLLTWPSSTTEAADGYQIIGKQIVVWNGDHGNPDNQFQPYYYDFTWYKWDVKKKIYIKCREGFTKAKYEYIKAERDMPRLATNPDKNKLVLSQSRSFAQDAINLASGKIDCHIRSFEQVKWPTDRIPYAKVFALFESAIPNADGIADVAFLRDGKIELYGYNKTGDYVKLLTIYNA